MSQRFAFWVLLADYILAYAAARTYVGNWIIRRTRKARQQEVAQ